VAVRAVAVVGPSQSGKTTLIHALAELEGPRGKTFEAIDGARVTTFEFMQDRWALFEVPGGLEHLPQMGAVLAASDAAILVVPAQAEAAVLSAPYLRMLEASNVPTFIFVNGIDTAQDRVSEIIAELQQYCAHGIVLRQVPLRSGDKVTGAVDLISERAWAYHEGKRSSLVELPQEMQAREQSARAELLETLADFDDHLLEEIIEDQKPPTEEIYDIATRVLQHHDLLPALLGSARNGSGVLRLMKSLRHEAPDVGVLRDRMDLDSGICAIGCLADNVKHLGKVVLIRALSDGISAGAKLGGDTAAGLNDLDARAQVPGLAVGEVGLTIKSDHLQPGRLMSADALVDLPDWARPTHPPLKRIVRPVNERDENKLPGALARMAEMDLGLEVSHNDATGQLQIGVHGPQHERRIVEKLADGFGIEIESSEAPTALRESIRSSVEIHHRHRKQSGGAGQFADVVIELAPQAEGSGFAFVDTIKGGVVPRNYIPAVEAGAREALAEGPEGNPVVDLRVTLKDGKAHSVDSSDFAFRTAGKNAVREGLAEAGTRVLQPIMQVHIHVPSRFAGDLVQIVSGLKGQIQGFENNEAAAGWDIFHALLPMNAEEKLANSLGSHTRGTAWFESTFDHYEPVH
jgi:elongation factor G